MQFDFWRFCGKGNFADEVAGVGPRDGAVEVGDEPPALVPPTLLVTEPLVPPLVAEPPLLVMPLPPVVVELAPPRLDEFEPVGLVPPELLPPTDARLLEPEPPELLPPTVTTAVEPPALVALALLPLDDLPPAELPLEVLPPALAAVPVLLPLWDLPPMLTVPLSLSEPPTDSDSSCSTSTVFLLHPPSTSTMPKPTNRMLADNLRIGLLTNASP